MILNVKNAEKSFPSLLIHQTETRLYARSAAAMKCHSFLKASAIQWELLAGSLPVVVEIAEAAAAAIKSSVYITDDFFMHKLPMKFT